MKAVYLFIFSMVVLLVVILGMTQGSDNKADTIEIKITSILNNSIGRTLENIEVINSLPLDSKSRDERFISGSNGDRFITTQIEMINKKEFITSVLDITITLDEKEVKEKKGNPKLYSYSLRDEIQTEKLTNIFNDSDTPEAFLKQFNDLDSLYFLASKLSEKERVVRIVSGVKLISNIEQTPICWIQESIDGQWKDISIHTSELLVFKVMSSLMPAVKSTCQNVLVDAWALELSSLSILLKR